MNYENALGFLEEQNINYVLAQFVDIHGVPKTKSVPVTHFASIVQGGAGFAGFAVWGLGMEPHSPDFMAIGDLSTLTTVPWQPGYARIVFDGHVDGKPWSYDVRCTLKNQIKRLADRCWTLYT